MKKYLFFLALIFIQWQLKAQDNLLQIIPKPDSIIVLKGEFLLTKATFIHSLGIEKNDENFLISEIKKRFNIIAQHGQYYTLNKPSVIRLTVDTANHIPANGYMLYVSNGTISVSGSGADGVFNGLQTLLQLAKKINDSTLTIPCCLITDYPQFKWRGMHLDVSRHFFTKEEIKQFIDLLAYHKLNIFHWHLTDDQGWRIEIKKYPLLTQIGSVRTETMVAKNFAPYIGDGKEYGGFYTQNDIREIVTYAYNRHIMVVPEIEMPGHSQAAIAAYPSLSCNEKQYQVLTKWGVSDVVLCTKPFTINFIKDVLTEIFELFPSEYIHIGGDEVTKTQWKNCAVCKQNILQNKLANEDELQSWFIKQIDSFASVNHKKIIGWDEILEGGISPNAAIMSWRGTAGGIIAAKQKHEVVMCPGSHCYFDHYQGSPLTQPLAIGGFTTVQKVYDYKPIPEQLIADEKKYILGAQANLWTEYITNYHQLTFMALPRMSALAEILWTSDTKRNFNNFQKRLITQLKYWDEKNIKYSKALLDVQSKVSALKSNDGVKLEFVAPFSDGAIKYKVCDTCSFKIYKLPLKISKSLTIQAQYENESLNIKSEVLKQKFYVHKACGKKISLLISPNERYNNGGVFTLVDGIKGMTPWYSKEWLGFSGDNCVATIDLGEEKSISKIKIGLLSDEASWIYLPDSIQISYSLDSINFIPFFNQHLLLTDEMRINKRQERTYVPKLKQNQHCLTDNPNSKIDVIGVTARYIQVEIKNIGVIPPSKPGAGEKAWLFVDEIEVR